MEVFLDVASFGGKAILITICLGAILILIAHLAMRNRPPKEQLDVQDLGERFHGYADTLHHFTMDEKTRKIQKKLNKKKADKKDSQSPNDRKRIYVLDFHGDIRASATEQFRKAITAVLSGAQPGRDEVVVRLESTGGMVHAYGFAAAQMLRVRQHGLTLTVCVDKVAASGGYMMACTGQQILAAPFAILGSIGVIAQVPNLHRILKKHDVDYEEITAGEFKRTVSLLGEITDKGRQKFIEQIEDTHRLFKDFVHEHRPQLHLEQVATGEYWFGQRALDLGLVDKLMSSDEYLFKNKDQAQILEVQIQAKKSLGEKIAQNFSLLAEKIILNWWQKIHDETLLRK